MEEERSGWALTRMEAPPGGGVTGIKGIRGKGTGHRPMSAPGGGEALQPDLLPAYLHPKHSGGHTGDTVGFCCPFWLLCVHPPPVWGEPPLRAGHGGGGATPAAPLPGRIRACDLAWPIMHFLAST